MWTSHNVIVNSIAATTTRTGLRGEAHLALAPTFIGIKVTDAEINALPCAATVSTTAGTTTSTLPTRRRRSGQPTPPHQQILPPPGLQPVPAPPRSVTRNQQAGRPHTWTS
ncbi:hypothetical protein [Streptomyces europaeiscabiei]|uniref:hypothetical protein n=1 Tax=Streptomyces europaeiscabiei TaxID=146819 RepID=UPI00399C07A6